MLREMARNDDLPQELRRFVAPEFVFGVGARELAGACASHLGARHLLVVTDKGTAAAGWVGHALASLEAGGLGWSVFSSVSPNPRTYQVMEGAEAYLSTGADGLLAVGGGSPMDCAKGIGIVVSHRRPIEDFEGVDRLETSLPPLICIPTTAGSSADISQFAILSNEKERRKIAVISKGLVPELSLVDPLCTTTMDPFLTACTGLDALTHAIEAFVSSGHSPFTDLHALEAIRLVFRHLPEAVEHPQELSSRTGMALASLQAGLAFSNASLGAVHAMAHVLGGRFDLPHGECNALLLEHVVAFNFSAVPERYRRVAETLGVATGNLPPEEVSRRLRERISALRLAVGVSKTLGDLGISRDELPDLAQDTLRDACVVTNPRVPTPQDLVEIYARAF